MPGNLTPSKFHLVIVTGLAGAGRSSALKILEDFGFDAIDNLPILLLDNLIAAMANSASQGLAIGLDLRTRAFNSKDFLEKINILRRQDHIRVTILYLESDTDTLQRRFSETRRRHPLAIDRPVVDGIRLERRLMKSLAETADSKIDTSSLTLGQLKERLGHLLKVKAHQGLIILLTSFSYRYGVPREADLVFDVRFLTNPHYNLDLRPLTGQHPSIADFIMADPSFAPYDQTLIAMLEIIIPRIIQEGKSYLTICFGCTGGRHRSVFMAEKTAQWCQHKALPYQIIHRELPATA